MAYSSNLHNGENSLDDLFECFIETLCSTHTAVAFDTDANRKLEFKAYLFTAIVPITTVATGLGYTQEDPDFNLWQHRWQVSQNYNKHDTQDWIH